LDYAMAEGVDDLGVFHRTSLLLHLANTVLIVVLMYMLFGGVWPAALVGLLFGVHPITVETIPWVGERKTLLAAFFGLWSLIFYVGYARSNGWSMFGACLVAYVLALMSKPTSTPLPVAMLLMDYWPLKRLSWRAVAEKMPFLAIGLVSAVITYISQKTTAAVYMPSEFSVLRIPFIICHNIIFYLYKLIWPTNMSAHYPFPEPLDMSDSMVLIGVVGTLALITLLLVSWRRTRALLVGWLIFMVLISPTMQVIGFSNVIASDKYAYIPLVGLLLILGWALNKFWLSPAARVGVVSIVAVVACLHINVTRKYHSYWKDTESLFSYMLRLEPEAASLHDTLGNELARQGRYDEAIVHFRRAVELIPIYVEAYNNMGIALAKQGKYDEAIECYKQALGIRKSSSKAQYNWAIALEKKGRPEEAVGHYYEALRIDANNLDACNNLGVLLAKLGRYDEAYVVIKRSIKLAPNYVNAYNNLGGVLRKQGKIDDACEQYRLALEIDPTMYSAHYNLADALMSKGDIGGGVKHFREVLRLKPGFEPAQKALRAALEMQKQAGK
ncbi:MAG: tetratricopeptide repeat protein, partial [Planctomycetota bacterium]